MRSRVTPGMSCTMEILRPTSRLKSADLPTFGRPTIATVFILKLRPRLWIARALRMQLPNAVHDVTEPGDERKQPGEVDRQIEKSHFDQCIAERDRGAEKVELKHAQSDRDHLQKRRCLASPA